LCPFGLDKYTALLVRKADLARSQLWEQTDMIGQATKKFLHAARLPRDIEHGLVAFHAAKMLKKNCARELVKRPILKTA
jgi:hypothetical protein